MRDFADTLRRVSAQPDPLESLCDLVRGQHRAAPLDQAELEALARAIPVPGVHPRLLLFHFRAACGLEPVPGSARVADWLRVNSARIGPVLELDLRTCPLTYTDWSVSALEFIPPQQYDDPQGFTERIWRGIRRAGAAAAIGGYNHVRPAYGGGLFATGGGARTLHLGLDVFIEAGSPVLAPLDGVVHSVADNAAPFDYGPCVVLEHRPDPDLPGFFTLYGHLGSDALELRPGQALRRGDRLGQIGDHPTNGNWPPHLHLQLILDMLGRRGDFWGSCHPQHAGVWLGLCPDANLITQVPASLFPVVPLEKQCSPQTSGRVVARGPDGTAYDACGQRAG